MKYLAKEDRVPEERSSDLVSKAAGKCRLTAAPFETPRRRGSSGTRLIAATLTTLLLIFVFASSAHSLTSGKVGQWNYKLTGYFKNIVMYTESTEYPAHVLFGVPDSSFFSLGDIEEDEHWDNYTRLRLRMTGRRGGTFAWELHYEIRGLALKPDMMQMGMLDEDDASEQWLPLDDEIYDEPGYKATHMLDRAWFRWTPEWGEVVAGRQAITWTVGKLWFPTDLFGPFLPFDIDQDEKRGVDAANFAVNLGDLSSFRIIYAPLERQEDARVGARLVTSFKGFDLNLMGGYFSGDRVIGGSISHNFAGAVIRAEGAYTHPIDQPRRREEAEFLIPIPPQGLVPVKYTFLYPPDDEDRWSVVVNADAGLPHNIYMAVEYFHQSAGAQRQDEYWKSAYLYQQGKLHGYARDYLGLILNWQATPLLSPGLVGVLNALDTSFFVGPNISWEPIENVKLTAAANLFVPYGSDSEFGMSPNTYFASVKAYF